MADESLYTNVVDVLRYMQQPDPGEDVKAAIAMLIEPISRRIDEHCRQTFYGITKTKRFDYQDRKRLWLNEPLLSITSFVNGNGTAFTSDQYFLYPTVGVAKHWIDINIQHGIYFQWSGTPQQCISLTGVWGKSLTAPSGIQIATAAWISRFLQIGNNAGVQSKSIGAFSVSYATDQVAAAEIPGEVKDMLKPWIYRNYKSMGGNT